MKSIDCVTTMKSLSHTLGNEYLFSCPSDCPKKLDTDKFRLVGGFEALTTNTGVHKAFVFTMDSPLCLAAAVNGSRYIRTKVIQGLESYGGFVANGVVAEAVEGQRGEFAVEILGLCSNSKSDNILSSGNTTIGKTKISGTSEIPKAAPRKDTGIGDSASDGKMTNSNNVQTDNELDSTNTTDYNIYNHENDEYYNNTNTQRQMGLLVRLFDKSIQEISNSFINLLSTHVNHILHNTRSLLIPTLFAYQRNDKNLLNLERKFTEIQSKLDLATTYLVNKAKESHDQYRTVSASYDIG